MGKRRKIILIALALLTGVSLAIFLTRSKQPNYQGKPLTVWLEAYRLPRERNQAAWEEADKAVRHIGTNAIPTLLQMLRLNELGAFKRDATSAIPALVSALKTDEEYKVRENIINALSRIGNDNPEALRAVVEALGDSNPRVRAQAARFLPQFENKAKLGRPELLKCLEDPDSLIRGLAAEALKQMDPDAAAIPILK